MTREEAIEELKDNIKLYTPLYGNVDRDTPDGRLITALEMAVKTLENHDIFMKRAYSQGKQDALSQEPKYYPPCEDCHKRMDEIRRIYDKLQGSNDKIIECPWCGTVIQHKVNNKGGAI